MQKQEVAQRFVFNLFIAFLPLAILGLLFGKAIKAHLFAPVPVALAFIIGGFIILWAEKRNHTVTITSVDEMHWKDALKMGLAQALALIPGTSRSGSTIIGAVFRPVAPRRNRVFLLSRHSDHDHGNVVRSGEIPRPVPCR